MEMIAIALIAYALGASNAHQVVVNRLKRFKEFSALKKDLLTQKANGQEWFDFSLSRESLVQVDMMKFMDKAQMSYSMCPSTDLKRVLFVVDLENPLIKEVDGNVIHANFARTPAKFNHEGNVIAVDFRKKVS